MKLCKRCGDDVVDLGVVHCRGCRSKHSVAAKVWRKNNPAHFRAIERKRRYGISSEEFERMYADQAGKCAICLKSIVDGSGQGRDALAFDHDHRTGRVRGLLCAVCNRGLGMFEDDPERLRQAAKYIERSLTALPKSGTVS